MTTFTVAATTARQIISCHETLIHSRTVFKILKRHMAWGLLQKTLNRTVRITDITDCNEPGKSWINVRIEHRSSFPMSHDLMFSNADGRCQFYRRLHKRFVDNFVLEIDRFGWSGDMLWGSINNQPQFSFTTCHFNGILTARRWVDEIRPPVIALIMQQHSQGNGFIFQKDNARAYGIVDTNLTSNERYQRPWLVRYVVKT